MPENFFADPELEQLRRPARLVEYKDGRKAQLFDRVRFQNGMRYDESGSKPTFAVGRVIAIDQTAHSCELTIVVGSLQLLGSVNLPQFAGDPHPPRAGVVLDGYFTDANAKECEILPRDG